ncbi:methyltransferase [Kribbella sp. NPDC056951]|uniref:methyltransferase n=1 Tax=Kribbella sp. NPDC056951 TaxID=3345978 RepID=UPI003635A072
MNLITVDDTMSADRALRLIRRGHTLRWEGDFQNARQLLAALGRRTRKPELLNSLLIATKDYEIRLRRAPEVYHACLEAYGAPDGERLIPLRELLGVVGAHQLRKRGIYLPALGGRIHPHYGVFAPTRSEYVDLVAAEPLPSAEVAFDIGTGTGVLAAVLLRRGIPKVVATDNNPRAVACAQENLAALVVSDRKVVRTERTQVIGGSTGAGRADAVGDTMCADDAVGDPRVVRTERTGVTGGRTRAGRADAGGGRARTGEPAPDAAGARFEVVEADLFPVGRADLVVCNPPWVPGRARTVLDTAVYDEDSRMLRGFLHGVREHLNPGGEAWLVLSDVAELLGLRSRDQLLTAFREAGLRVVGRSSVVPTHRRARVGETTSLWRLRPSGDTVRRSVDSGA